MLEIELIGMLVSGFALGWLARYTFVQCNKYRMLKRLEQWTKEADLHKGLIK
ncbi:hypothetical protein KXY27_004558 [Salmonella enterica]|nr:hypothetical protein [Salmonella enterica]EHU5767756.1 hypothetical protein [Salmonella enterica]